MKQTPRRRQERRRQERRRAHRRPRRATPRRRSAPCRGVNAADCALPIVQSPRRHRSVLRAVGHRPRSAGRRGVASRRDRSARWRVHGARTARGRSLGRQTRCAPRRCRSGRSSRRRRTSVSAPRRLLLVFVSRRPPVTPFLTAALAEPGDPPARMLRSIGRPFRTRQRGDAAPSGAFHVKRPAHLFRHRTQRDRSRTYATPTGSLFHVNRCARPSVHRSLLAHGAPSPCPAVPRCAGLPSPHPRSRRFA